MHGGGYIIGRAQQDDGACRRFADELGIVVASVDYRLAPEAPFPAALDDCLAALQHLAVDPSVDAGRIAVGGASAGGGLAAALALRARDEGGPALAFQLAYPMIDDRTAVRGDLDSTNVRAWSPTSNALAWRSYLGTSTPGAEDVPPLAAPARAQDPAGLPPAWINVGTLDLFHDEDAAYAARLEESGVPCTFTVSPGAFHGSTSSRRGPGSRATSAPRSATPSGPPSSRSGWHPSAWAGRVSTVRRNGALHVLDVPRHDREHSASPPHRPMSFTSVGHARRKPNPAQAPTDRQPITGAAGVREQSLPTLR
jgi:acetyl esterase/lipase